MVFVNWKSDAQCLSFISFALIPGMQPFTILEIYSLFEIEIAQEISPKSQQITTNCNNTLDNHNKPQQTTALYERYQGFLGCMILTHYMLNLSQKNINIYLQFISFLHYVMNYNTPMWHFGPYATFRPCQCHFVDLPMWLFGPEAVPCQWHPPPRIKIYIEID